MSPRIKGLIVAMLALAAWAGAERVAGQASTARPTPPWRQGFRDRYSILSEQNMFLRERRRRRPESADDRPSRPPPRREEDSIALRGVVFEEGDFRAYLENLSSNTILRLTVGDKVAQGRISQIAIDAVEYEQNGRFIWVDIGRTLTGGMAPAGYAAPADTMASTSGEPGTAASQPAINPNDPNLTLEQRMRLRRQQQLGGAR